MINKIIHVSLSTTVQTQTRTYNKLHEIFDTLDTDGLGVEKPCVVQLFVVHSRAIKACLLTAGVHGYLTAETIQAALGVVAQRWQGGKRWQKTSTR